MQLGASYHTGTQSNTKYEEGYQAAAKYINAGRDEIGNIPDMLRILVSLTIKSPRLLYHSIICQSWLDATVPCGIGDHSIKDGA